MTPTPIDIDGSTKTLQDLLDLMTKPHLPTLQTCAPFFDLFKLCDMLGCEVSQDRLLMQSRKQVSVDPWATFTLASQYEDLELATIALSAMGDKPALGGVKHLTIENLTPELIGQVIPTYLLKLIQIFHKNRNDQLSQFHEGFPQINLDWQAMA